MKLTTSGNLKALSCLGVFYTKADICVQLSVKSVTEMTGGDVFTLLSCKRAVIYQEVHGDSRLRNLLEWNCLRVISAAKGISDMNFSNTGNCNN